MNKTQKGAMIVLALSMVLVVFLITIPIAWFNDMPFLRQIPLFLFFLTFVLMGLSIIFLRKKQSPSEVDYDERDVTIKRKAVVASYVTLWLLVLIVFTAPAAIIGEQGSVPVIFLPIAPFPMFIIVMLVYSLVILIQYGWRNKNE
jgi:hypothetical protein